MKPLTHFMAVATLIAGLLGSSTWVLHGFVVDALSFALEGAEKPAYVAETLALCIL